MESETTHGKEVYVSGRIGKENRTRGLIEQLEGLGYQVTVDWTDLDVSKPYLVNRELNATAAMTMAEAARNAEYFVLLVDEGLLGAHIETGIAIGASLQGKENRIFVVGKNVHESIFYSLPNVEMVEDTQELLNKLKGQPS